MILIGLAGVARSGKDTAAGVLAREVGLYSYAFADPIKRMLEQVFGDNFVHGDREQIEPISGVSYRTLMQTLGTEWGRNIQPDLWTRVAKSKWEWVKEGMPWVTELGRMSNLQLGNEELNKGMVISDVRFDNEAGWIRSEGGIIVHIDRPGTEKVGVAGHVSEQGVTRLPYDLVVMNDCTMEHYYSNLDYLVALLKSPGRPRPADGRVFEVRLEE